MRCIMLLWVPLLLACSPPGKAGGYLDDQRLRGERLEISVLDAGRSLLCDERGGNCVCREALACGADGRGCPGFDEAAAALRSALAAPPGGRRADCRRAEIGRCGEFRYLLFNGDTEKREVRWFDAAGRLVALRLRSDHPAYCEGRAMTLFRGPIPHCEGMQRSEVICGEAGPQGFSALDDALSRAPRRQP